MLPKTSVADASRERLMATAQPVPQLAQRLSALFMGTAVCITGAAVWSCLNHFGHPYHLLRFLETNMPATKHRDKRDFPSLQLSCIELKHV